MGNKPPAFQFYPKDWLSDPRVRAMTLEQRGAYIMLLGYDWIDDGLIDDDNALARLSELNEGWFKGGSTVLRNCFNQHPTKMGYITNPRLMKEREKQQIWREKSRDGGIKSGKSRKNKGEPPFNHPSTTLEPPYEPNGNIAVCSLQFKDKDKNTPPIKQPPPQTTTPTGANAPESVNDEKKPSKKKTTTLNKAQLALFEQFYAAYPKRVSRGDAEKAWAALNPSSELFDKIMVGLSRLVDADYRHREKQYIKAPGPWIRQKCWDDEPTPPCNGKTVKPASRPSDPIIIHECEYCGERAQFIDHVCQLCFKTESATELPFK